MNQRGVTSNPFVCSLERRKTLSEQKVINTQEVELSEASLRILSASHPGGERAAEILFFFFHFYLFIYLFIYLVFVAALRLSLVAMSGGYSSLQCAGFSLWWPLLLQSMGSGHRGFSSCSTRAQ